jgi:broad specificity phosphatase PhoE
VSTNLFLVRHAEVEESYQRVFGGRIDMNLSPRGHQQALALATYLCGLELQCIYASPMKRVQQTLSPFLKNSSVAPTVLTDLREVDFGDWTGHVWENVREKFGISAYEWLDQLSRNAIPNAENIDSYRSRVESCIQRVVKECAGQNVMVACHGGVIRMVLSILLELPLPKMSVFEIDYASVTHVELRDSRVIIQSLNHVPHNGQLL